VTQKIYIKACGCYNATTAIPNKPIEIDKRPEEPHIVSAIGLDNFYVWHFQENTGLRAVPLRHDGVVAYGCYNKNWDAVYPTELGAGQLNVKRRCKCVLLTLLSR